MVASDSGFVRTGGGWDADALSERLMAGEILVIDGLAPMRELVARAQAIAVDCLGPGDPREAEARLPAEQFRKAAAAARRRFREDPAVPRIWQAVLAAVGLDPAEIYGDRLILRIQPSQPAARGPRTGPLPAHRDTWGSNIWAQVNWWAPVWPLTAETTMLIWPHLFGRPVENDSADWDLDELMRRVEAGGVGDYPLLPSATAAPDPAAAVPVLIEPGSLLAFSGAHLHASADNPSGTSRFSFDSRTVSARDLAAGRAAANPDGAARCVGWRWFHRLTDGAALAPGG